MTPATFVGTSGDDWGGGPAGMAYTIAVGTAQADFAPMSFEQMAAAYRNAGGSRGPAKGD